ncbi:MAG: hypothetical protein WDN01_21410 [Rhizomicrobium sp.]
MADSVLVPSGLARWEIQAGDDVSEDMIAELRAGPRFSEAMRFVAGEALSLLDRNPTQHRLFDDSGRFVLGVLALYLDATGGLTHRRLRDLSSAAGSLSSGRATAILMHLRVIGYVEPADVQQSGPVRRYVPTRTMLAAFKARLRIEFDAASKIEPEVGRLLARFDEPEVFRLVCATTGDILMGAAPRTRAELAIIQKTAARRSGMLLLYCLHQAADKGGAFPAPGTLQPNLALLATRLHTSRGHILSLMRELQQAGGYIHNTNGIDSITPLLSEAFAKHYAIILIGVLICTHRVLNAPDFPPA